MNNQKPQKPFSHPEGHVELHSIFATIQGEGIFAGQPATFIRLAGCNLRCPSCDTEYTNRSDLTSPKWILDYVNAVTAPNRLVVITGGEPFRQDLNQLLTTLVNGGFRVQIETNGTMAPTYDPELCMRGVHVVCSPKTSRLHQQLIPFIDAYKYVLSHCHVSAVDGLPTRVLDLRALPARPPKGNKKPVYIQPMDSQSVALNTRHLEAAKRSALTHGYTLCLQIHKLINVE